MNVCSDIDTVQHAVIVVYDSVTFALFSVVSVPSSSTVRFVPVAIDFGARLALSTEAPGLPVTVTVTADLVFDATGFFFTTIPFMRLFTSFFAALGGSLRVDELAAFEPGKAGAGAFACFAAKRLTVSQY